MTEIIDDTFSYYKFFFVISRARITRGRGISRTDQKNLPGSDTFRAGLFPFSSAFSLIRPLVKSIGQLKFRGFVHKTNFVLNMCLDYVFIRRFCIVSFSDIAAKLASFSN
jgi:hypothetical protein